LRIERLEIVPYALPFREPYVSARGRLERRELLLLRLAADGHEGLGEAASLSLRGGPERREIERELDSRARAVLEGTKLDPREPHALVRGCAERGISRQALAAVELGLLDLCGKLADEPVWRLLGAERVRPVACNATLSAGRPEEVAQRALRWAAHGFESFKLKVGLDSDVEQVRAVRDALGARAQIRIDANGAWSPEQAVSTLGQLEPLEIELAEQPAATLEGLAAVRRSVKTPVAADESVGGADDARAAVASNACDAATVKIAKVGGISAAREIAAVLPVYLSSALDGPVGIAAAAHLAQVLPTSGFAGGLAQGLATGELFEDTIASVECELTDAALLPSDTPGLGVEIDERALARRRL